MGQVVLMPSVGDRNATWIFFEGVKDDQQVRQRAIPSIQLPNDRDIASVHKRERLRQFMSFIGSARGAVFKKCRVWMTKAIKASCCKPKVCLSESDEIYM